MPEETETVFDLVRPEDPKLRRKVPWLQVRRPPIEPESSRAFSGAPVEINPFRKKAQLAADSKGRVVHSQLPGARDRTNRRFHDRE
jgi:hypothetical protein